MIKLTVNNIEYTLDIDPDMPLLWVLREKLHLTGTKYGCGRGLCGSCNVLVNGKVVRSCAMEVSGVDGKKITTIEGLAEDKDHPVIQAWLEEDVSQCGYCHPGQIISAVALLEENPDPSDSDIDYAMANNICRCGAYRRIKRAIHRAADIRKRSIS